MGGPFWPDIGFGYCPIRRHLSRKSTVFSRLCHVRRSIPRADNCFADDHLLRSQSPLELAWAAVAFRVAFLRAPSLVDPRERRRLIVRTLARNDRCGLRASVCNGSKADISFQPLPYYRTITEVPLGRRQFRV